MKKTTNITHVQVINTIFILYLILIIPILTIKQYDKNHNLMKHLYRITDKNIYDLFSNYSNMVVNTTFSTRNYKDSYSNSDINTNTYEDKVRNNMSQSENINKYLKEEQLSISSNNISDYNSILNHKSSFMQTSLSNINDTIKAILENQNHNTSNMPIETIHKTSLMKNKSAVIQRLSTIQQNLTTLNSTTITIPALSIISKPDSTQVNISNKTQSATASMEKNKTITTTNTPVNPTVIQKINNITKPITSAITALEETQTKLNVTNAGPSEINTTSSSQNKNTSNTIKPDNETNSTKNIPNKNSNNTNSACPNNCSTKGICVNGNCLCLQGYTSEDCSMTYKEYADQGIALEPMIKWFIIIFIGVFMITMGILLWKNNSNTKAGDYLELD